MPSNMLDSSQSIMSLDVGARRIGVALANAIARLPSPLATIVNDSSVLDMLDKLIKDNSVGVLVVGWPRGMQSQHTDQTRTVEAFATILKERYAFPLYLQDEVLTSHKAEQELKARGKAFEKGDIDALAATYILEDFLQEHPEVKA